MLSANLCLPGIERAKWQGTAIFPPCTGEWFSYHGGLKCGIIIKWLRVSVAALNLTRSNFVVRLGEVWEVTQTHTTFKVIKFCSLELQVIKLSHNFILTKVVGKLKDSVLIVNKTKIQTGSWCLEVKKRQIFFHWTSRLPCIFNIPPPRADGIPWSLKFP